MITEKLPDRSLLQELVKALVEEPELVKIREQTLPETGTSYLLIQVDPKDRGKVIGKGGRTIEALRYLFICIASLAGRRVYIEVDENGFVRKS